MSETRIAVRPREAARLLGIRPERVREMCRTGELPARQVARGSFLISRSMLEDWLRAGDRRLT